MGPCAFFEEHEMLCVVKNTMTDISGVIFSYVVRKT